MFRHLQPEGHFFSWDTNDQLKMDQTVIFVWMLLSATAYTTRGQTEESCNKTFTNPENSFTGPYYEGDKSIVDCFWKIQTSDNVAIKININYVDLDCSRESIEIYDGDIRPSARIGKICDSTGWTFVAVSGTMSVLLHRDSEQEGQGFIAFYETGAFTVPPVPTTTTTTAIPPTTLAPKRTTTSPTTIRNTAAPIYTSPTGGKKCGGTLSLPSGHFSGPQYLGDNSLLQCVWEIQASRFHYIVLHISYISLDCSKEYIEIFDGSRSSPYLLGRICSDVFLRYNYTSSSDIMTVRLHRESEFPGRGFDAYYSAVQEPTTSAPDVTEKPAPPVITPTSLPVKKFSCSGDYMVAHISRAYIQSLGYKEMDLFLNSSDPECSPQVSEDYVIFNIPISGCGTVRQQKNNDTIIYSNIIKTFVSGYIITRKSNFQFRVMCGMNENTVVETAFVAENSVDIFEKQNGYYNVTLEFYHSSSFLSQVYESPYFVTLNQDLYVQATLHSSDRNLVLFIDTCVASPFADNFETLTYDLIRNGCARDSTYRGLYSPRKNEARFQFNSFKFLNQHNEVYLQCKLVVCGADDTSSRCYQGCLTRSKRDVGEPQEKVDVVAGPIKLQGEDNKSKKQDLVKTVHPGGNGPFVPVVAVAAVLLAGMVFVVSGFLLSVNLRKNNYHQIY